MKTDGELERRKRVKLSEETSLIKRQIEIMLARKDRVPEEHPQGEDKVVVRVCHLKSLFQPQSFARFYFCFSRVFSSSHVRRPYASFCRQSFMIKRALRQERL